MATALTTGSSVADASQFTTAEIVPTASAVVIVFVSSIKPIIQLATVATPKLTGCGLTWQLEKSVFDSDGDRRLTCFRAMGKTPTRGALTINFSDQIQNICAWSVFEYTDVDTTGVDGSGAIGQSQSKTVSGANVSIALTPEDRERDRIVGAVMLHPLDLQSHPVSTGDGFTQIHQQTPTQAGTNLTLQTQESAPGATQIAWSWTGTTQAAAIAVGVKAPKPAGPSDPSDPDGEDDPITRLTKDYTPVLHLHPDESFVPISAQRYVESAALWADKPPFDDNKSWGTAPLVAAGGVSTVPGTAGYLGTPNFTLADATNERFLELGGWKTGSGTHEPDVSAATTNLYADRGEIKTVIDRDLADGKFWFHTEVFDTQRLTALAAAVKAPDLSSTLRNFTKPTLLCYYLFYPAHEQGVDQASCPNTEAKELACHAGDWHCVAILLEEEGVDYTPKFFGITGSRPAPMVKNGVETFRPYAFDAEGRVAMKVEAWRSGSDDAPVQPDVRDGHPRFYVARGSHSMYTAAGVHEVAPYEDATTSGGCGKFDTPGVIPPGEYTPPPHTQSEVNQTFLKKVIAGGILGGIAGLIGFVAGIVELLSHMPSTFGAETPPASLDTPNNDLSPVDPNQGITVRPNDLLIDGVTSGLQNWSGSTVVDRGTQVGWPSDDGTAGFRGRWGQRVASDPVLHRAGVKFPEFWKMFFLALEQGFGSNPPAFTRPQKP